MKWIENAFHNCRIHVASCRYHLKIQNEQLANLFLIKELFSGYPDDFPSDGARCTYLNKICDKHRIRLFSVKDQ